MNRIHTDVALIEWFDKVEPRSVPPEVLHNALAVTRRSDQRRGLSGRVAAMFAGDVLPGTDNGAVYGMLLPAMGFALVAFALVAGLAFLSPEMPPPIGGPSASPSPASTTATTPAPVPSPTIAASTGPFETATPIPTATGTTEPRTLDVADEGPVQAGTYITEAGGKVLTFTVPDSQVRFGDKVGGGWDGSVLIQVDPQETANLWIVGSVSNIYLDACDWGRNSQADPPPGPTIDDFATMLTSVADRDVSEATEVQVGGHRALYLHIATGGGLSDFDTCDEGLFMEVTTPTGAVGHGEPGEEWDVWIVDVDGDRYWLNSVYLPDTSQQERDELHAIVESLTIESLP